MKHILIFAALCLPLCAQVKITEGKEVAKKVSVEIDGKPFTDFYVGPETSKPYLHPLRTAAGLVVTRGWPMVPDIPGEMHNEPHQTGLWFAHGDVNGYNFWAADPVNKSSGKGKGKIVLIKIDKISGGRKSGSIAATFEWRTTEGASLLTERRTMTFYSDPQFRTMDFDITLSPDQPVTFGDTKEGVFAMRLAAALEEDQPKDIAEPKRTGKITNAQNKMTEKNVWGKRSEWVDYSGQLNGQNVGVTIFENPSSPRQPTYWHVRGYGLFAANIFGVHDFEHDAARDGSLSLRMGQSLRFRYRVVIHPGDVNQAGIRDMYDAYRAMK